MLNTRVAYRDAKRKFTYIFFGMGVQTFWDLRTNFNKTARLFVRKSFNFVRKMRKKLRAFKFVLRTNFVWLTSREIGLTKDRVESKSINLKIFL